MPLLLLLANLNVHAILVTATSLALMAMPATGTTSLDAVVGSSAATLPLLMQIPQKPVIYLVYDPELPHRPQFCPSILSPLLTLPA